jgi:hypothetical protein
MFMLSPTNEYLYARRVYRDHGFKPNVSFDIKAAFLRYRCFSMLILSTFSVLFFAYVVRIYERPYYNTMGLLDFESLGSSIWVTWITMSAVGYGGMFPSTSLGRGIMVFAAIVGAFILSILIS